MTSAISAIGTPKLKRLSILLSAQASLANAILTYNVIQMVIERLPYGSLCKKFVSPETFFVMHFWSSNSICRYSVTILQPWAAAFRKLLRLRCFDVVLVKKSYLGEH